MSKADERRAREMERERKIREEYGDTAMRVDPYKPNREQRRRQAAAKRAMKSAR